MYSCYIINWKFSSSLFSLLILIFHKVFSILISTQLRLLVVKFFKLFKKIYWFEKSVCIIIYYNYNKLICFWMYIFWLKIILFHFTSLERYLIGYTSEQYINWKSSRPRGFKSATATCYTTSFCRRNDAVTLFKPDLLDLFLLRFYYQIYTAQCFQYIFWPNSTL